MLWTDFMKSDSFTSTPTTWLAGRCSDHRIDSENSQTPSDANCSELFTAQMLILGLKLETFCRFDLEVFASPLVQGF